MTPRKGLVLDGNILLRAVFGRKVREILELYDEHANFYSPDLCFQEVRTYIPDISSRRHLDVDLALSVLDRVELFLRDSKIS